MSSKPESLEMSALIGTLLWTGASLEQALSLQVLLGGTPAPDCDLALRIGAPVLEGDAPTSEWRVRVLRLPYKNDTGPPAEQARVPVDFLCLPDPVGGSAAVQQLLTTLRDDAKDPLAQPDIMTHTPLQIFSREPAWYKEKLQKLLDKRDSLGRITATKISHVLFQKIMERTGGDVVSAALITRTDHHLASVRRYYATPDVRDLQQIYVDAVGALNEELGHAGYKQPTEGSVKLAPRGISVGSALCPTIDAVQDAVRRLKEEILRLISLDSMSSTTADFVRAHNLYTLYSVWSFGFAVGIRGVRTPYLHSDEVNQDTGFAVITDKDSGTGYKSRLIWVPESNREQMKLYDTYLSSMARARGIEALTRKRSCYFLGDNLKVREVRPRTVVPFTRDYLAFPANVARHFVCTQLRERGVAPEYIDLWMGHWARGEEPWGALSTLSIPNYKRELERVLPNLLEKLGFEPICLRYRGGSK